MAERLLKIGMVGAGFIGQLAHLMNYVEVKRCKVVALAEFRPELRAKVARRYDIPRAYAKHEELLRDPEVEAVVLVTPRPYTVPTALDCLRAGKHIITEKPMAGTSEQAQQLVDEARNRDVNYVVGYMKRHDEGVQLAKRLLDEAIASDELGPVLFARTHCYMGDSYCRADGHVVTDEKVDYPDGGWPTAPSWMPADQTRPYASFVNTYSHNVNLLRYLFGRTPTVEYASVSVPGGVPLGNAPFIAPGQVGVLNFGGFRATVETGKANSRGWDEVTEVFFVDGRLTIKTPPALLKNVPASVEFYKEGKTQQIYLPQPNWTWAFRRQAEAFVNTVLDGTPSLSLGSDSIEDLRLIEALWRNDLARTYGLKA